MRLFLSTFKIYKLADGQKRMHGPGGIKTPYLRYLINNWEEGTCDALAKSVTA